MAKRRLHRPAPRIAAAPTRIAAQPKQADPIYKTPEYQAWRAKVINRAGGRCQWRDGASVCGRKEPRMFADHVRELKDGGSPFDTANGQCLCGSHHSLKTASERARRTAA